MKRNKYIEVAHIDPRLRAKTGVSPFIKKKLLHVLRGEFCFDYGTPLYCGGTFEVEKGEERKLTLGFSYRGIGVGIEQTHQVTEKATYSVGDCDSATPVLWYRDAEVHVYESVVRLGGFRWVRREDEFFGFSRPGIHMNRIFNDPECECHEDQSPPRGGVDELDAGEMPTFPFFKAIATVSFAPIERTADEPEEELGDVAEAAAYTLEQALEPSVEFLEADPTDTQVALTGVDGESQPLFRVGERIFPEIKFSRLTLMSGDCADRLRGGLVVRNPGEPLPILGFAPNTDAERAKVQVFRREPEADELSLYQNVPASVRAGVFTAVWSTVDLGDLPDGTDGYVEIELLDASDRSIGLPTRIPFVKDDTPIASAADVVVGA